jgi:hypothetical protein
LLFNLEAREVEVSDRSQVMAATVLGGALGALAAYMFFTEGGRTLRRRLEPALVNLAQEVNGFRQALIETAAVATGGWRVLVDLLGDDVSRMARRFESREPRPS